MLLKKVLFLLNFSLHVKVASPSQCRWLYRGCDVKERKKERKNHKYPLDCLKEIYGAYDLFQGFGFQNC